MTEDDATLLLVQNWIIIALLIYLCVMVYLSGVDKSEMARNAQHKKLEDIEGKIGTINYHLKDIYIILSRKL